MSKITFFVECEGSAKRFHVEPPSCVEELNKIVKTKFEFDGMAELQIRDAQFDVMCEVEDIEQLYNGAKLELKMRATPIKAVGVAGAVMSPNPMLQELRSQIEGLQRENSTLKLEVDAELTKVTAIEIPEGFHVRLGGLPYNCTNEDIENFFAGLTIVPDGIFMIRQLASKLCKGEALVTFQTEEDWEAAKAKHKEEIGTRWIEVREANDEDFRRFETIQLAGQLIRQPGLPSRYMARLRGMEYAHTRQDVLKFLEPVEPTRLWIIYNRRAQNGGTAYVQCATENDLQQVLKKKKQYLGERWIDVWEAEHYQFKLDLAEMCGNEVKHDQWMMGCKTLAMNGLPRETTDEQLSSFFRAVGFLPIRIHRKSTGEHAYVEFFNEKEAKIAMTRNNCYIGSRYIQLKCVSDQELESRIQRRLPYDEQAELERIRSAHGRSSYGAPSQYPGASERYSPYPRAPIDQAMVMGRPQRTNPYDRDGVPQSGTLRMHKNRYVEPNPIVKITGLPFTAQRPDITRFFRGYSLNPASIYFLKKDGKPTGTCKVTFDSTEEATRAINDKNGDYVGERYVYLGFWNTNY